LAIGEAGMLWPLGHHSPSLKLHFVIEFKLVINLVESDFRYELLLSKTPVLIHVDASYDPTYEVVTPVIEEVAREYKDKLKVVRLDYDINMDLAVKLGSYSNSILIMYVNGKKRERIVRAASKKARTRMIDTVINNPKC
jgi:thioredoxin